MKKIFLILFFILIFSIVINIFFYNKILNNWCFLLNNNSSNFTNKTLDQVANMLDNENCS